MQNITTVSSKGQVTIPKSIRDLLSIGRDDRLIFSLVREDLIAVKPANKDFLAFGGSVKPKRKPENFTLMRRETLRKIAQKISTEGK